MGCGLAEYYSDSQQENCLNLNELIALQERL
jgi:hypothetical protein